jgi:DMSO/TMAO reductase YedYZ molybdopterin-dependent catalytic subunit
MLAVTRAGRSIAVRLAGGMGSAAGAAKAGSVGIVGGGRRIRGVALFSSTRGGGNGQGNKGGWNRSWSSRIGILAGFGGACALGVLAQSLPLADCQAGMSGGAGGSPCPVRGRAKQEEGAEDSDKDFLTPDQLKALPAPGNPEGLPIYTRAQVAEHSVLGEDTPVWVIYKDGVYDITDFISGHPGGAQKIMLAAGKGIEPYWRIYQQHFNTKFALETLAGMRIGTVDPTDMLNVEEEEADPYASDPVRSDDLIYHGIKPCNAETPSWVHADNYITPNDLFYVRHHSPVPEPDMSKYRLEVEGQGIPVPASLTLEQIKALPKREVTVTIQCAGNRRSHFESVKKTQVEESTPGPADTQAAERPAPHLHKAQIAHNSSPSTQQSVLWPFVGLGRQGIGWDTGAISTAVFGGVYLRDVLSHVGLPADYAGAGVNHIHFVAVDEVQASIPSDKAMSPAGEFVLWRADWSPRGS